MRNIIIESKGVEKLLSNLKTSKAVGPDIIPYIVLITCASELSVGLGSIFQYSLDTWYSTNGLARRKHKSRLQEG